MKKTLIFVFLVVILIGLTACGKKTKTDKKTETYEELSFWTTYPTDKIIKNRDLDSYNKLSKSIEVDMISNEYEASQLVIEAGTDSVEYYLKASDLRDDKGNVFPKENIEVYALKYMLLTSNFSIDTIYDAGDYVPDMMLPMDISKDYNENIIEPYSNQGIIIDFNSEDVTPSKYTGKFELTLGDNTSLIDVTVNVRDIAFQGKSELQSCFLIYRHDMLSGEYDNSMEIVYNYFDFLLRYNCSSMIIKDVDTKEDVREVIERFGDNRKFNSIEIPYYFSEQSYTPYDGSGNPTAAMMKFASMVEECVKMSTTDNPYIKYAYVYITSVDEADARPTVQDFATRLFEKNGYYELTLKYIVSDLENQGFFDNLNEEWAKEIKDYILNMPGIFTNTSFYEDYLGDLTATICPTIDNFSSTANSLKYNDNAILNSNGKLWTYTCVGPKDPYPTFHTDDEVLGNRTMGWMEKANGINGFLYYDTNKYVTTPQKSDDNYVDVYNDPYRYENCGGDGYLLYPGRYYGSKYPFPSLRLLAYRDGADDYDALTILERKLEEYFIKYSMDSELELKDYTRYLYDSLFEGTVYVNDSNKLFEARKALFDMIEFFDNEDKFVYGFKWDSNKYSYDIYSINEKIKINGTEYTGISSGDGYKFAYDANDGFIVEIGQNKYEVSVPKTKEFDVSSDNFLTSNASSFEVSGNATSVTILSENLDGGSVIKSKTKLFQPYFSIKVKDLQNVNYIIFKYKATSETALNFKISLYDGSNNLIDTSYAKMGQERETIIKLKDSSVDLSSVTEIRFLFDNVRTDETGNYYLMDDRSFEIYDIHMELKEMK